MMPLQLKDLEVGDVCTMLCGCRIRIESGPFEFFWDKDNERVRATLLESKTTTQFCGHEILGSDGSHVPVSHMEVVEDAFTIALQRSFR
jgi:hypothetical protein